ncbi:MAG: MATE family efflux transporter, partial [Candidatus Aenigmatarchaeota archaeon]
FIASFLKLYFSKRIILENFKLEIDFKNIKRFFYLAFSNFISSFSSSFFPNILVISSFWIFSSIIAGVMFFSQLISATISFLVAPIVNASLPIISNLAYKKRDEDAKRIIQILFRISLVISITLIFPITFHLKTILEFLNLKQEFINYSPTFFLVISVSSLFFLISGILYSFLFSINRIKEIYLIEIFCILLFITLLIFISLNSNVLLFLLSYLFISFLRFFLYSLSLKSLFKSAPEKFNIKLSFLILFSFFISYTLTSKIFLIDISLLILSFILIIFIIKKIKIFEKKEKTFIQKLNLPEFMKKIIFKLI